MTDDPPPPTPETDAYWDSWSRCGTDPSERDRNFARRLERERNEATKQRDALADALRKARERVKYHEPKIVIMEEIDEALNTVPKTSPHLPEKHLIILHDNPTQFDYLHAIRALASRLGYREIFDLADKGMNVKEESS